MTIGETFTEAEAVMLRSRGLEADVEMVSLGRLGGSLRVLQSGEGPAVVLLHGAMTAGASWLGLVERLADFRMIMVDRPGCGLSPLTGIDVSDLDGKRHVADHLVADLLDGLDIDRAHLITNSLGGWYGLRSAAAHPDRIDRYFAMGYQVGVPIESMPLMMRLQPPTWIMPRRPRVGRRLVKAMLTQAGMRRAIESGSFTAPMIDYMTALLRDTDTFRNEMTTAPRPATLRGVQEDVQHDQDLLASIVAPVHVFWGDEDPFAGRDVAERFVSMLPNATLRWVDEAGHAPWIDRPDLAEQVVRDHLTS